MADSEKSGIVELGAVVRRAREAYEAHSKAGWSLSDAWNEARGAVCVAALGVLLSDQKLTQNEINPVMRAVLSYPPDQPLVENDERKFADAVGRGAQAFAYAKVRSR